MKKVTVIILSIFAIFLIFLACSEDRNPLPSKTHPKGWAEENSQDFHGKKVLTVGYASCTDCHGAELMGGESHVSCFSCHQDYPHKQGWVELVSDDFHGNYIKANNWSMERCQTCHGTDYRGGEAGVSCYKCHTDEGGPEACNVCHGSQTNPAPPKDLDGNIETSAIGVGAHQLHMQNFDCAICHVVPATLSSDGHIDDTPGAEVLEPWGWNKETATCANACHTDTTKTYIWNNF